MFSRTQTSKTVFKITDTDISYITLEQNKAGFFVPHYDRTELPEGIIKRGEILKADIFGKILKKIASKLSYKKVDILLEHDYFLCNEVVLPNSKNTDDVKKRVKDFFIANPKKESWYTTHVCEFQTFHFNGKDTVAFTCLPKDVQKSYLHVFKKSGFKVSSLQSDILAFNHLFTTDENTTLIKVQDNATYVIDFKKGMYLGSKKFQLSYQQLIGDIVKNIQLSETQASKILNQYGFLRTHKDQGVYKRLLRSGEPLFSFMKKRKFHNQHKVYVIYDSFVIPGFADMLSKYTTTVVDNFDIFIHSRYSFQDILSIHKKDTYMYQAHIAQALRSFKKEK